MLSEGIAMRETLRKQKESFIDFFHHNNFTELSLVLFPNAEKVLQHIDRVREESLVDGNAHSAVQKEQFGGHETLSLEVALPEQTQNVCLFAEERVFLENSQLKLLDQLVH